MKPINMQRTLLVSFPTLLLMLLPILSVITNATAANYHPATFCSRALATQSCPTPPTFDSFNIESYLGHWYEIGSTASFKLLSEAGLACDQAQYTAASGKVSLVNSGLKVIGSLALVEVGAVSLSARGVCSQARDVCSYLAPDSAIRQAVQQVSNCANNVSSIDPTVASMLSQISSKLLESIQATEWALQAVANDVNQIQQLDGQLSQANASLKGSVDALKGYANQASNEQVYIMALVGDLYKAQSQLTNISKNLPVAAGSASVIHQLEQAADSIGKAAKQIASSSSAMQLSLKAIKASAVTLQINGQPITDGKVSSVNGGIVQNATSAGKLEVSINGVKAPYWILAVDGEKSQGYAAALVYSCTDVPLVGLSKSLFILSRTTELSPETVNRFLSLAGSYGIYTDCEDPFLFTVQQGENCGKSGSS